jgi:TRAP-type mannitol/chloroaromatic compound transport system permease large subunit
MEMLPLLVMFLILFFFMALGIPIAFAFGATNILAIFLFVGPHYINILYNDCFSSLANFLYIAFPLFILMGELFHHSGVAEAMVKILRDWVKWLPGSLGITTVIGCGIFGAISGSGMAACATFGVVMIMDN